LKTKYPIERFVETLKDQFTISRKIADGIRKTVKDFAERFDNLDEAKASQKPQPEKWSRKEILGHLIDSAANNHQRFVRVQYLKTIILPSYEQKEWVNIQHYNSRSWKELLLLWKSYNFHLAHILDHMPAECLHVSCTIGSGEPLTIGYIVVDYLGHLQHHLWQIEQM
jgi:DinB superfamily